MSRNVIIVATIIIALVSVFMGLMTNEVGGVITFLMLGALATVIHVGLKMDKEKH